MYIFYNHINTQKRLSLESSFLLSLQLLDSFNDGSDITVLGITFTVIPGTTFNPEDKAGLVDGAKVSIKDNGADGTADEVEVH